MNFMHDGVYFRCERKMPFFLFAFASYKH